jgi:hypothetical protein
VIWWRWLTAANGGALSPSACYNGNMTIQEIQRTVSTQPFEPFRIYTADGREFDVRHPENLAFAGTGRLIAIGMEDYFVTLDLLLVTGIARPIPNGRRKVRR